MYVIVIMIPIRKVVMGTNNTHSPWAITLFNIVKQLAIYFRILDPSSAPDPPMPPQLCDD